MRCFSSVVVTLLLSTLLSADANAFSVGKVNGSSGPIIRWYVTSIDYWVDSQGSADIFDGSDLADVQNGFQQWSSIGCSKLKLNYKGTANAKNNMAVGGPSNGKNEISWAEGSEWIYGNYVLGITQTQYMPNTGEITEADIAFNGYTHKWSTNGKQGTIDVLNVATHEEGHFIGAQHNLGGYSAANPPTMAPAADPNLKSQDLNDDDKKIACFLYPASEYTCSNDANCPLIVAKNNSGQEYYAQQITCVNGLCGGVSAQIPEGTKTLGEECASDFDCIKPHFCQPTGTGNVCSKKCNTDADCGQGFKCYPYSNAPGGLCLPFSGGGGPAATKNNGDPCSSPQECKSGLCVGFANSSYCREPCTVGGSDCPAGEQCTQLQGSNYGACIPVQGGTATKTPGEPCSSPNECITGLCVGSNSGSYKCREPCDPQLGDCPADHECFQLAGGNGGACFPVDPKKDIGEQCQYKSDCLTDVCLSIVGSSTPPYCSKNCITSVECPCGMECSSFTSGSSLCTLIDPPKVDCTPSGNPCTGSDVCISHLCFEGVCRDQCKVDGVSACPPGQACQRKGPSLLDGYCAEAGIGIPGAMCTLDSHCEWLLCLPQNGQNQCMVPCDPNITFCGDGNSCQQHPGTVFMTCQPTPVNPGTGTGSATGAGTGGTVGTTGTGVGTATGTAAGSGTGVGTNVGTDVGGGTTTGVGTGAIPPRYVPPVNQEGQGGCASAPHAQQTTPLWLLLGLVILMLSRKWRAVRQ